MDIQQVARQAAHKAWCEGGNRSIHEIVADAVAVAVLREAYQRVVGAGDTAITGSVDYRDVREQFDQMLAAFTPAEPPQHVFRTELAKRITGYLSIGGLFNPEAAEHDKVRDLLIDCRHAIEREFDNHHGALSCPYCIPSRDLRDVLARHSNMEIIAKLSAPAEPQTPPVTISADDFECLALMGMTQDGRYRVGEGGAERVLEHAKKLVFSQAHASARPARTLKEVVGEMLTIYGVRFDDANSREVAINTWARQLTDALLSGGAPHDK